MTGGGFGGSAIALVPAERLGQASTAVRKMFRDKGFREPNAFAVTAGGPATRDR
jgi:galactokinase